MRTMTVSLAAAMILVLASAGVLQVAASGPLTGVVVCLDPGHGGSDPGAVNEAFVLEESAINLDVAFALKILLEEQGASVAMTRTDDDTYLTNDDRYTFCNGELATILVSVHTNSVTYPTWDGSMTLYAPNRSPALAQAVQEKMYSFLLAGAPDPAAFRDWELDHFASGVLFKCDMPAALVEPLFMSHPAEAELLTQTIFVDPLHRQVDAGCAGLACRRGQIAQAVMLGLSSYFESVEPPPTPVPDGNLHVGAIDMAFVSQGANYSVQTRLTVHDSEGNTLSNATIALTVLEPDGSPSNLTGITGKDGSVTLSVRSKLSGWYASTVTAVSKEGWVYDPAADIESEERLRVP